MIRVLSRSGEVTAPPAVGPRPGQPTTTGNHQYQRMSSGLAEQALSRETGDQPVTGSIATATRMEDKPVTGPTPDVLLLVSEAFRPVSGTGRVARVSSLQPGPGHAHPR